MPTIVVGISNIIHLKILKRYRFARMLNGSGLFEMLPTITVKKVFDVVANNPAKEY